MGEQVNEKRKLDGDRSGQQSTLNSLKKEEGRLRETQRKQEKQRKDLEAAIRKAIKDAIAPKPAAGGTKPAKLELSLTPEARELIADFEKNKGKLPWPVEKGLITSRYGKQPHPVLKGITIDNVADEGAQAVPRRQPVSERAEADALNLAAYPNRPALERGHARRCRSRWLSARVSHHRAPAVPAPPPDRPPGG